MGYEINEQRVDEILNLVDSQDFSEENLKKYTYAHLAELYFAARELGKISWFKQISQTIYQANVDRLKCKRKIVVAFIVSTVNSFCGEEICRLMESSDRFEPYVFVTPNFLEGGVELEDYNSSYAILREKKHMRVIPVVSEKMVQLGWKELGIEPDVIFYPTPYPLQRGDFLMFNNTLNTLSAYIPYGITGVSNKDQTFPYMEFNQVTLNIMWKIFALCKEEFLLTEKYCDIGSSNLVYSGYPKMDTFYHSKLNCEVEDIWKVPEGKTAGEMKKIIYAPHHTLPGTNKLELSTFHLNGEFMLEMAKRYPDVTWLVRPHPQLGTRCVQAGFYSSREEYKQYLARWDELPNARVYEFGPYDDVFKTSDAMIMDCGSFLGEYLYVNKPLLFLRSEGAGFNEVGEKYMQVYEQVAGDDLNGIEAFIEAIVTNKPDSLYDKRNQLFEEVFDYVKYNGKSASQFIVDYLEDVFKNE